MQQKHLNNICLHVEIFSPIFRFYIYIQEANVGKYSVIKSTKTQTGSYLIIK